MTWGEALVVAAHKSPGGLNVAVKRIQDVVGPMVGTRNTFAKFFHVAVPTMLNAKDRYRAWLLLHAFEENPNEWGIDDEVVPAGFDRDDLVKLVRHVGLEPTTR